ERTGPRTVGVFVSGLSTMCGASTDMEAGEHIDSLGQPTPLPNPLTTCRSPVLGQHERPDGVCLTTHPRAPGPSLTGGGRARPHAARDAARGGARGVEARAAAHRAREGVTRWQPNLFSHTLLSKTTAVVYEKFPRETPLCPLVAVRVCTPRT